jgi:hypothetical protein
VANHKVQGLPRSGSLAVIFETTSSPPLLDATAGALIPFGAVFFIPECLPDLTDLTDDELREALLTTMLRMLRV